MNTHKTGSVQEKQKNVYAPILKTIVGIEKYRSNKK
jgi:hypothetical protein